MLKVNGIDAEYQRGELRLTDAQANRKADFNRPDLCGAPATTH